MSGIGGPVADYDAGEVTALLRAWHAGDEDAYSRVSSILYDELKRRAAHCMRGEQPGDVLQTTALVHETFMRLAPAHDVDWQDRRHFLAVAARTMRRVLVDLGSCPCRRETRVASRPSSPRLEHGDRRS